MLTAFGIFIILAFGVVLVLVVMSGINRPKDEPAEQIDWYSAAVGAADAEGIERLHISEILDEEQK